MKASLEGVTEKQNKDYNVCPATYLRTLITPKGVYVCPYWRAKSEFCVGDVNEMSFEEMWKGEQRKNTMEKLNPSVDCDFHCLRNSSNLNVFEIKRKIEGKEQVNSIPDYDRFI